MKLISSLLFAGDNSILERLKLYLRIKISRLKMPISICRAISCQPVIILGQR